MKTLLLALIVSSLPAVVRAQGMTQTVNTTDAVKSTHTCQGLNVSSTTPTNVVSFGGVSSTTAIYTFVAVQNLDGSGDLNCSDNVNVSTLTTSGLQGIDVAKGSPGATVKWALFPGQQWYCLSQNTANTGTVGRAAVCRGR